MDMGYTQVMSHEKAMNMIFNYGILKYVKRWYCEKKKNVTVHNEKVEYEWDGPIIYPSRRELTEEEKESVEERHKKLGIED